MSHVCYSCVRWLRCLGSVLLIRWIVSTAPKTSRNHSELSVHTGHLGTGRQSQYWSVTSTHGACDLQFSQLQMFSDKNHLHTSQSQLHSHCQMTRIHQQNETKTKFKTKQNITLWSKVEMGIELNPDQMNGTITLIIKELNKTRTCVQKNQATQTEPL